ncbi:hypothetical protein IQ07DRAFT_115304 [Pyrenochaeta sp. DS3sAY3a]|nr:hypothetical protein IQ07DRAFT_115304 [Pyrenochaeta sp. DS3sAY3a]
MVLPPNLAIVLSGAWQLLNSTPTYLNGTLRPPSNTGIYANGTLIYHPLGFMSANIISNTPSQIAPVRPNNTAPTDEDYILIGKHTLSYAGGLHAWPGSNATHGTLTHGPLTMATAPKWRGTNQTRNYVLTKGGFEGRDVLHLWLRNEEEDSIANLHWARIKA